MTNPGRQSTSYPVTNNARGRGILSRTPEEQPRKVQRMPETRRQWGPAVAGMLAAGALLGGWWQRQHDEHAEHADDDPAPDDHAHDPLGLVEHLQATGRFCRDTVVGGALHWGKVSLREISDEDSLHITLAGNRLTAHIDRLSPLHRDHSDSWMARYSVTRAIAHTLAHVRDAVLRFLTGTPGTHRVELVCERREIEEENACEGPSESDAVDRELETVTSALGRGSEAAGRGAPGLPRPARSPDGQGNGTGTRDRLPFSAIDEVIQILDAEAAPWSIQLEAELEGSLDEERLREAVREGLGRHPLAHVRKVPSRATERGNEWELVPDLQVDPVRVIDCPDEAALGAARGDLLSLPVPLLESPPLRVALASRPDGDHLILNANHVAFDGFGALRVLRSIGRAYRGAADPVPEVDLEAARDVERLFGADDPATRRARYRTLLEKVRDLVGAPARLAPDGASDRPGYGFHQVVLSPERTATVVDAATGPSTVNDILLAALHLAIVGWNSDHGVTPRRIGVLMPVDLWPDRPDGLVGNYTLPVRVTTSPDTQTCLGGILGTITDQTRSIKEADTGAALIEVIGGPSALPIWAKRVLPGLLWLTGNRLVDTAMLSNLGRIDDPPSFGSEGGRLAGLWFSPPARMPLGLAVGVVTVRDRLHLVFRYRHRLMDGDAARRFSRLYLRGLDLLAER